MATGFEWSGVSYKVQTDKDNYKTLLDNVRGQVLPTEMVAIMGGSGAGKSTLLNTLAGRIGPGQLNGQIKLLGQNRHRATWNLQCAYVEQDDVLYKTLTVKETITYAALLRLPRTLTKEEKMKKVDEVIAQLGLDGCKNTRIGDEINRGISGGERKRVAIAIELVTNPKLLFLDEPTSGLDAFNAFNAMSAIKKMAQQEQKMVLCTIHQPRTDILELFDKIILLSAGKLVWYGTTSDAIAHFSHLGYHLPPKTNPSDFFLDITTMDRRSEELTKKSAERVELFTKAFKERTNDTKLEEGALNDAASPAAAHEHHETVEWPSSPISEYFILMGRFLSNNFRDKAIVGASLGMSIFTTILIGCLFWQLDYGASGVQNRQGLFFFLNINLAMGNIMPVVNQFPEQRKLLCRERAAGSYRSYSAFLAAVTARFPLVLIGNSLTLILCYWLVGLQVSAVQFFTFLAILYTHIACAVSLGMSIGASVPSVEIGQIVTPLIIVIFILFSGLMVNISSLPSWLQWIQWISIFTYTTKALSQNEFSSSFPFACPGTYCKFSGPQLVTRLGLDNPALWNCVLINFAMAIGYLIIGTVLFEFNSRPKSRLVMDGPALKDEKAPVS